MKIDFQEYQCWINKYVNNHDTREINFQNDVVKRLLEKLFPKYDIVCVDTKGCNSTNHNYYAYSGKYTDSGTIKPTTPDLLICKNWDWYNVINKNIQYIATVEIKSPYGLEAIHKKDYKEYSDKLKKKIHTHLEAENIEKVILTDTFKWEFYIKGNNKPTTIMLVDTIKKGRGYTYKWCDNADDLFQKLINFLYEFLE